MHEKEHCVGHGILVKRSLLKERKVGHRLHLRREAQLQEEEEECCVILLAAIMNKRSGIGRWTLSYGKGIKECCIRAGK